ncbi:site-specific integrase [Heliorestis convoluta]|uniref:Site-specific recombinase, phage integrase family n=1 Tax=Heliorestis convoluta TaxID=356322 RepID=A0A5Q2N0T4_9FIRM|nr:site-specific integrase [Heliorestis convoluta]QGG47409.1 Site-specific recombinase, phage integrase family [Heliorestis convoluta]
MPSIEKRGDTYRIMVSLGYNMEGKQIRKTTTFKPPKNVSEKKAEKLATSFAYDFEKKCMGMTNFDENMRFSELVEWYFEQIAPHKLKERTLLTNIYLMKSYVLPYIGHLKLKDITTARIDEMLNHLYKRGKNSRFYVMKDPTLLSDGTRRPASRKTGIELNTIKRAARGEHVSKVTAEKIAGAFGKKLNEMFVEKERPEEERGIGSTSIARIRTATSAIFNTALKKDIIWKNPVVHATSPRGRKKDKDFLDADQCKQLLEHLKEVQNPNARVGLTILIYTGMRSGELCGLHWQDVNLKKGTIYVRYTLYRADGKYKLSTPKTKSSERVIAIPSELTAILKEHKEWQEKRSEKLGSKWKDRGAVVTGMEGEYLSAGYLNTTLKKLLKKYDLPDLHVHDLRHANASLLINAGVPVKFISEHLGHSNTKTTEDIYAHVYNSTAEKVASAISDALDGVI